MAPGHSKSEKAARCAAFSNVVGVRGFEPPTPSSRTKCATKLRYTPMSAGRESTESPDMTQAFFCFRHKKRALRSIIQRFMAIRGAGLVPVLSYAFGGS